MYRTRLEKMYTSYGCIQLKIISFSLKNFKNLLQRMHITFEIRKMLFVEK